MRKERSSKIVKDYTYWQVQVFGNQSYLGRCVIWCQREDACDLLEATAEEQQELFIVLREVKAALRELFQPDWFNYAFLGNDTRHLHGHLVPRYQNPKTFQGVTFTDERWGHNFKTDNDFVTPNEVLIGVRDSLRVQLGSG